MAYVHRVFFPYASRQDETAPTCVSYKIKKNKKLLSHAARGKKLPFGCEFVFVAHSKPPPRAGIQILHHIKVFKKGEKKKSNFLKSIAHAHSPVKAVQGRPVLDRRSCLGCRPRVIRDLEAGCREAAQHSRMGGTRHQALRHREHKKCSDDSMI